MKKEAMTTRHPLRRSPDITVADTAPKTETAVILPLRPHKAQSSNLSQSTLYGDRTLQFKLLLSRGVTASGSQHGAGRMTI